MNTSSSFDLLPLFFNIFAFSQNRHLKNGVLVGSGGIPLVHFLVSFIARVEQCPICWCHSLRSCICCDSFGGREECSDGATLLFVIGVVLDGGTSLLVMGVVLVLVGGGGDSGAVVGSDGVGVAVSLLLLAI